MKALLGPVGSALALLLAGSLVAAGAMEARGTLFPTARLETGRLLVARPGMLDPNFAGTVVLLFSYGEAGAAGVIVNRSTRTTLSHALPQVEALAERPEVLFRGGPVAVDRLIFTFRATALPEGCLPVLADVCASGSLEVVSAALDGERPTIEFKGFAGHAGWAPGQLEWEIEQDRWYVVPGDSRWIFDSSPDDLWPELIRLAESPLA